MRRETKAPNNKNRLDKLEKKVNTLETEIDDLKDRHSVEKVRTVAFLVGLFGILGTILLLALNVNTQGTGWFGAAAMFSITAIGSAFFGMFYTRRRTLEENTRQQYIWAAEAAERNAQDRVKADSETIND